MRPQSVQHGHRDGGGHGAAAIAAAAPLSSLQNGDRLPLDSGRCQIQRPRQYRTLDQNARRPALALHGRSDTVSCYVRSHRAGRRRIFGYDEFACSSRSGAMTVHGYRNHTAQGQQ